MAGRDQLLLSESHQLQQLLLLPAEHGKQVRGSSDMQHPSTSSTDC